MISVSGVFTVSNGSESRDSIRVIPSEKTDRLIVSVDFYAKQSVVREDPLFNCSAVFFGDEAQRVLDTFTKGLSVQLTGFLVQKLVQRGDKTYVNNEISRATFHYLPQSNSVYENGNGAQANPQAYTPPVQQPAQVVAQPVQYAPQPTPAPVQYAPQPAQAPTQYAPQPTQAPVQPTQQPVYAPVPPVQQAAPAPAQQATIGLPGLGFPPSVPQPN